MSNIFKSTRQIVQEMCDEYKAITGITKTPDQKDDTDVIKFYTDAAAISSLYSTSQNILNDFFPQTASEEALKRHLQSRGLVPQIQPQTSKGQITITGTDGTTIPLGTQVSRTSDGELYSCIQAGIIGASSVTLFFESVNKGNTLNIDATAQPFSLVTSISGALVPCVSASKFLDGRDLETPEEMLARIETHDRDDDTGGNAVAYERFAKEASNEVISATVLRLVRGIDTVDVIITSGTSDISAAVEAGQIVTRLPSVALIDTVQAYIEIQNPVTDDVLVKAPTEQNFDVTVRYTLLDDNLINRSYAEDQMLKTIKTFIYQAKSGSQISPTDLERLIDKRIGDLIKERFVDNFAGIVSKFQVPTDKILTPNVITFLGI